MGILQGKKALIFGVANKRSIAWGIAKAMYREGATIALSYANPSFLKLVSPLALEVISNFIEEGDETSRPLSRFMIEGSLPGHRSTEAEQVLRPVGEIEFVKDWTDPVTGAVGFIYGGNNELSSGWAPAAALGAEAGPFIYELSLIHI